MTNPRKMVQNFKNGMGILSGAMPETIPALGAFINTAQKEGVLTCREKELIAIGVALYTGCNECIAVHCQKAFEAGCTRPKFLRLPVWPSSSAVVPCLLKAQPFFRIA